MNRGIELCLILWLWFGATATANGQDLPVRSGDSLTDRSVVQYRLRLTTSITKQAYCIDAKSRRMRLSLRLNFTNTGTVPILIDKKSSVVARTSISRNLSAAAAKKYVYDATYSYSSRQAGLRWSLPEEALFATLNPNESYSLDQDLSLFLDDGTKNSEEDLHPGSYLLQIKIGMWYYPIPSETYRQQWTNKGYLWSKAILSEPMPITVLKVNTTERCAPMNETFDPPRDRGRAPTGETPENDLMVLTSDPTK